MVYIAGQLGLDIEGKIAGQAGDFRAQVEQAFKNLKYALAEVGATFDNVVKINNYLRDISHVAIFREVRDMYVNTAHPPASTTIAISDFARPGALFEVEAVAVLPAKAGGTASARRGAKSAKVKAARRKRR